ncbi:uncharacterized protein M6B38_381760 [Iris pallida]|uniref:Hydroxyproline-rich glycoprotein family protein n=1 Tax=Iris pallida TaxID=29817 RepID=A0AAX6F0K7_IRIPA|nr:uncharacterized protein M6B38_162995 [Iris pallida]KAJ6824484.1 uncharacterized protein M6B38_381760 [Iris pallida]
MAGNNSHNYTSSSGASVSAVAAAVGSADAAGFPHQSQEATPTASRSRWGSCFGGLSCFGSQKGGKRVVPASRISDGNASNNRGNGVQSAGPSNQNTSLNPSLLAPPSSPASFTNSALPSTAQSPSCFMSMSASSPGDPSSNMFVTGPYAHETQLVSPPVFSTFTTEPSTAPLTPPPELAHLTTPSSPDVPFAQFLSSSLDLKSTRKVNNMPFLSSGYVGGSDLQTTYPLYPGSPSSSLISPASGTPRTGLSSPYSEQEIPSQWAAPISSHDSPYSRNGSSKLFGLGSGTSRNFMLPSDSSFFRPSTSAQFYLDQAQQSNPSYSHSGGRLSVSREAEVYANGGNRHNKTCKQDVEEIEAYRASFGFSADEIITAQHYVEISDPVDDNFTMTPFGNNRPFIDNHPETDLTIGGQKFETTLLNMLNSGTQKVVSHQIANGDRNGEMDATNVLPATNQNCHTELKPIAVHSNSSIKSGEETITRSMRRQLSKRLQSVQSCSDAEVDYRRARSLKDVNGILAWRGSPS